ncbi:hypothetical protein PSHT_01652 [Puccinia striiformis]|uniref:Uncharacterized protein n=1 Tax=Puccinia striiformis TaxID=27350 RepID=A0A2S4WK06_9BASI|nr:hypothetical protein PSHT_01652 [Puccinia striiformis]
MHSQVQLVYALVVLWNFIRYHNQYEDIPEMDNFSQGNDTGGDMIQMHLAQNIAGPVLRTNR